MNSSHLMRRLARAMVLTLIAALFGHTARSQVLISLLFGDDLNTGKVEFGLEGGATFSTINGLNSAGPKSGFNLGFYFDIKLKHQWSLATGVMVKSPWGAKGLPTYSLGDAELDSVFHGGSVERRLNYFNVPIMAKYSFGRLFAMAGPQLSLGYKSYDVFSRDIEEEEDLTYRLENRSLYRPIEAGLCAAAGVRLYKGYGMNLLVRYYHGLTEIRKDPAGAMWTNRGWHLQVGIPIGVGKARARAATKEQGATSAP
ncbi:MAG: PorT family protein [Flavobacteriales bacterium]|nr:PorT family protein [Flavobacteriales bacterium]